LELFNECEIESNTFSDRDTFILGNQRYGSWYEFRSVMKQSKSVN